MASDEFGDFQTPLDLAQACVQSLPRRDFARILEPTCGTGSFLKACVRKFPAAEVQGIEIQAQHVEVSRAISPVQHDDLFALDLRECLRWKSKGPLLIVGNPPWVTASHIGVIGSQNSPAKSNLKSLAGLEAITGAANFDIAESIFLKLILELQDEMPTVALLCKTQVARNVLQFMEQSQIPLERATIRHIDSMKWFRAAVDACFFTVSVGVRADSYRCEVFDDLTSSAPSRVMEVRNGRLVADVDAYLDSTSIDGHCPMEWRQGIKHDASSVMELKTRDGRPVDGSGTQVISTGNYVYPMLKCTDVFRGRLEPTRMMIVPNRSLSEDPRIIEQTDPSLWRYLTSHGEKLDGRKSSIYLRRPRFTVFGVGDYSFKPFKVAVSGMHKEPVFRVVGPQSQGKPVVFDDTCYFLSFDDPAEALAVWALLGSTTVQRTIQAIAFWDAKRPITKRLLSRLDFKRALDQCDVQALITDAENEASRRGFDVSREEIERAVGSLDVAWS